MIHRLSIQNLILIENAHIEFGPKLNIITGETGAGKSAIFSAIHLILGAKADPDLIRRGENIAIVEADIEIQKNRYCIRRELHKNGKSRCFFDDELITLLELKSKLNHSIEIIGQSSSLELCEEKYQREILDLYAQTNIEKLTFYFEEMKENEKQLKSLIDIQNESSQKLSKLQSDLDLLNEVDWKKDEEEKLNQEYNFLSSAHVLLEKASEIAQNLSEGPHPILLTLKRYATQFLQLQTKDPKFQECTESMQNCVVYLEEISRFLSSYLDQIEINPERIHQIEKRIQEIEMIKRRFGASFEDVQSLKNSFQMRLERLSQIDNEIESMKSAFEKSKSECEKEALKISAMRKERGKEFAKKITEELLTLNLPDAQFSIQLTPKPLSENGIDQIQFLFSANLGSALLPLEKAISGGELSRLFFSMKTSLSEKDCSTCLIFDEIDGNIGGKTASIFGEKLKNLADKRQLICVTHFVQVAKYAIDHFLVSKQTKENETKTQIEKLNAETAVREYMRMTGID